MIEKPQPGQTRREKGTVLSCWADPTQNYRGKPGFYMQTLLLYVRQGQMETSKTN